MKLTPSRKAKLIVVKLLEFAEIGGMEPEDSGTVYEAISNCLDVICINEGDESVMENLIEQVQQIINVEELSQELPDDET